MRSAVILSTQSTETEKNMQFKITALILMLTADAPWMYAQEATPSPTVATAKYTCVMHPEVVSNKPGKCPKCGMELVPMRSKSKASPSPSRPPSMEMQPESHPDME